MINEKIHQYILDNREAILKDYIDILKIPSISDIQASIDILYFIKDLYEKTDLKPRCMRTTCCLTTKKATTP